jgi:flagellar motor switch protein FliM
VDERLLGEVLDDEALRVGSVFQLLRYDSPRLPGVAVMQRALLSRIIGAMLGDQAGAEDVSPETRPLTPVETRIAHRVLGDLVAEIGPAWPDPSPPIVEMDGPAGGPRVVPVEARSIEIYAATLDFGPPEQPYGLMCIAVPVQAFRDLERVSTASPPSRPKARAAGRLDRVLPLEVQLVVELSRIRVPLSELRCLRVGDVLPIGSLQQASAYVNGRQVLEVEAGQSGGQRSVRVLKRL